MLWASLTAAQASDGAERVDAFYPEGPLVVGETVLFAEMHADRIIAWEGGEARVFYESAGCGPTAIAPYGEGFAVLCHRPNEIHLISQTGAPLRRLDRDSAGGGFVNPNDASADGQGGVWFTASGLFAREAPSQGALLYLDAEGVINRVAQGLHYANGVHFDRRTRRLYVTEHLGGRILVFPERAPGRLGAPERLENIGAGESAAPGGTELVGPDGLETDEQGRLYVALYGAGVLYVLSPGGKTMARVAGLEPLMTNVALTGQCRLVVTGARHTERPPFPGSARRIKNPVCTEK